MEKRLERLHPFTILLYFLFILTLSMAGYHPVLQVLSFCLSVLIRTVMRLKARKQYLWLTLIFYLSVIVMNPILMHRGNTVLFYLNGNRITFEAFCYGCVMALMLAGIFGWCRVMTTMLTDDKIFYLFGRVSAKAALLISMVMHFIPVYMRRMEEMRACHRTLGLYRDDTLVDKIRAEGLLLSGLLTWAFEHSVRTADSMEDRGYGSGRRTVYAPMRFRKTDAILCSGMVFFFLMAITGLIRGGMAWQYYPEIVWGDAGRIKEYLMVITGYVGVALQFPLYALFETVKKRKEKKYE